MTVIVGIPRNGKVWIGADSAGSSGTILRTLSYKKVFIKQNEDGISFAFGCAGSFRMMQILQYDFQIPRFKNQEGIEPFFIKEFMPAFQSVLEKHHWLKKVNHQDELSNSQCLVGVNGQLFGIASDYHLIIPGDKYFAIGCADDVALGSLYTSADETDVEKRISIALRAAEHFSGGVRGPFHIISV